MLMEPQEREDAFFRYETMKWCVWEGIIFIMKKSRYADVYDRQK